MATVEVGALQIEGHNDLHMHVTIESSALTKDAVCGLRMPNKLLYLWYRDRMVGRQLIKALNEAILDKCMAVREDCNRVSGMLTLVHDVMHDLLHVIHIFTQNAHVY